MNNQLQTDIDNLLITIQENKTQLESMQDSLDGTLNLYEVLMSLTESIKEGVC